MREVEVKILSVNHKLIKKLIKSSDGKFVKTVFQETEFYKNEGVKGVVRLRKMGRTVILTVKGEFRRVKGHKIADEYEIELKSMTFGREMLKNMGLKKIGSCQNYREYYSLFNCSVEIVDLPNIPTYLEIEGKMKDIAKVAKSLGYTKDDYKSGTIFEYYPKQKKANLLFKKKVKK